MRISVVIPMYNASGMISRCLRALNEQDVLPDEVIVVDNHSKDNSWDIVEQESKALGNIKIILCAESKQGPSAARNRGIEVACGDVIAFTDCDCLPHKDWIKTIHVAFEKDQGLDRSA